MCMTSSISRIQAESWTEKNQGSYMEVSMTRRLRTVQVLNFNSGKRSNFAISRTHAHSHD